MSNFYAESVFDAREVVNHPYVEYKEEQYLPPQTDTSSLSNINVECRGSMDTYLDIANAYAKVEWKVTKGDGSNTDANTAASLPVPAQLFKRVSVALSGAEIDHCDDCGPVQAQLEKWESSGDQIVNANNLQAMRDLCEDSSSYAGVENAQYNSLHTANQLSATQEAIIPLSSFIGILDGFRGKVLRGSNLTFNFQKNTDYADILVSQVENSADFKTVISSLEIWIPTMHLQYSDDLSLTKSLASGRKMPVNFLHFYHERKRAITGSNISQELVTSVKAPKYVFIGLSTSARSDDMDYAPAGVRMDNLAVTRAYINVNGHQVPHTVYENDLRTYKEWLRTANKWNNPEGNSYLSYAEFLNSNQVFVFEIPDMVLSKLQGQSARITAYFTKNATACDMHVIILDEQKIMLSESSGRITVEY